ncbi:MAG: bifunctional AP-4-A phosphorylase/ADP sulfurylase [Vezdaea aestivalis]|nr:MAG: bifunctional AP-4-A phosphorylase/ADP sulfurylase [Vezdaea aestivalis]
MDLKLSNPLRGMVAARYEAAKADGSLVFSPTELATVKDRSGTTWQIRYCPTISRKPTPTSSSSKASGPISKNPFLTPSPSLLITPLPTISPTHNLLLNKYPIIPRHSILATRTFEPQSAPLTALDLRMAYAYLQSSAAGGETLFGFFNSGSASGASQAHRHLQFLPLEELDGGEGMWELLMERVLREPEVEVGFWLFVERIGEGEEEVHGVYERLYKRGKEALREAGWSGEYSYNLGIVEGTMALCPRLEGSAQLGDTGDVSFNGTMLAGTVLVKSRSQFDLLVRDETGEHLSLMLSRVGLSLERGAQRTESSV